MSAQTADSAILPTYGSPQLAFERGEGPYLFGTDGRRYLDFASGIAVTSLGHAHPLLVEALKAQADKFWHCSNLFQIPEQERFAKRLCEASFADYAFFCNSGAEAIEAAIKMTRKHHSAKGHPERTRIITVEGAFHGRTMTCISAAGNPKYLEGFGPPAEGFDQVAFGNMNELRAAITPETGGILVEPVQGEGGIRPAALDYIRGLRQVADEFGLLLIFDEIQCGMGRTGKLFAHEWAGVAPDIMALAKGIGGGFPIGATLATENAAWGMTVGVHGTTYGGNPLGMAVGNAVLDVLTEPGFLGEVDRVARRFWDLLVDLVARHPGVFERVRGAGLMLGLVCVPGNADVGQRLREEGMLTAPAAENVVRLLPPLIIGDEEVDQAIEILERVALHFEGQAEDAA